MWDRGNHVTVAWIPACEDHDRLSKAKKEARKATAEGAPLQARVPAMISTVLNPHVCEYYTYQQETAREVRKVLQKDGQGAPWKTHQSNLYSMYTILILDRILIHISSDFYNMNT